MSLKRWARRARDGVRAVSALYLRCTPWRRRDILLCCNMALAADYLGDFAQLFRGDPRLRFRVVFLPPYAQEWAGNNTPDVRPRLSVPEVSSQWAKARRWDLVVCADHCLGPELRQSKAIFIGHGPHNKSLNGGSVTYTYEESMGIYDATGRPIYRRIFEEREVNRAGALQANPALRDAIVVVGSLENDKLLEQTKAREEFRQQLGYGPEDIVVFVASTWGEFCLFRTFGDELLAAARELQPEFKFILSAHPHEYRPRANGERVWGEYLRTQRVHGFTVREPSESWIPYMVASDIVISDYSGLVEYAALLEKPIILTPVPEKVIWKHSITWKIRQFAPILDDVHLLRSYLMTARKDYPSGRLHELAQIIHPHPGQAAHRIRKEVYDLLGIAPRLS